MAKSRRMISRAKTAPAMGALKVAAMPAAAPQPIMVRRRWGEKCSHWPTALDMAAPIWMMGPSRPTEPPQAMVTALATIFTAATTGRMTPRGR